jgi:hypothetical protein
VKGRKDEEAAAVVVVVVVVVVVAVVVVVVMVVDLAIRGSVIINRISLLELLADKCVR